MKKFDQLTKEEQIEILKKGARYFANDFSEVFERLAEE